MNGAIYSHRVYSHKFILVRKSVRIFYSHKCEPGFKSAIFKFIRPKPSSVFNVRHHQGAIFLTRLRIGFSHLREHKFRHNFLDTTDPFCTCRTNSIETTEHYLLRCSNFSTYRSVLFNDLHSLNLCILPLNASTLSRILLYGDPDIEDDRNRIVLETVIKYILSTSRFSGSLFDTVP